MGYTPLLSLNEVCNSLLGNLDCQLLQTYFHGLILAIVIHLKTHYFSHNLEIKVELYLTMIPSLAHKLLH